MRLRQAHAILETATALEVAHLGVELFPLDCDEPGTYAEDDQITGAAYITDPDGMDTRTYNIELAPTDDGCEVTASVDYGLGPDPVPLWQGTFDVRPAVDADPPAFRGLVGAQIAARISKAIRDYEKPYRAAYELRSGKKWSQA
jgi:hypothetical protein